jgi:hypothetical protein
MRSVTTFHTLTSIHCGKKLRVCFLLLVSTVVSRRSTERSVPSD